jgi:hypothetical protein
VLNESINVKRRGFKQSQYQSEECDTIELEEKKLKISMMPLIKEESMSVSNSISFSKSLSKNSKIKQIEQNKNSSLNFNLLIENQGGLKI